MDNYPNFFIKTYFVTPLESSRQDDSNEGSQHVFLLRNKENFL